jgi:hypothetical protein
MLSDDEKEMYLMLHDWTKQSDGLDAWWIPPKGSSIENAYSAWSLHVSFAKQRKIDGN